MNSEKLNKEEIIPAEDILTNELEEVCGGAQEALHVCLKGCVTGDKKDGPNEVEPQ